MLVLERSTNRSGAKHTTFFEECWLLWKRPQLFPSKLKWNERNLLLNIIPFALLIFRKECVISAQLKPGSHGRNRVRDFLNFRVCAAIAKVVPYTVKRSKGPKILLPMSVLGRATNRAGAKHTFFEESSLLWERPKVLPWIVWFPANDNWVLVPGGLGEDASLRFDKFRLASHGRP